MDDLLLCFVDTHVCSALAFRVFINSYKANGGCALVVVSNGMTKDQERFILRAGGSFVRSINSYNPYVHMLLHLHRLNFQGRVCVVDPSTTVVQANPFTWGAPHDNLALFRLPTTVTEAVRAADIPDLMLRATDGWPIVLPDNQVVAVTPFCGSVSRVKNFLLLLSASVVAGCSTIKLINSLYRTLAELHDDLFYQETVPWAFDGKFAYRCNIVIDEKGTAICTYKAKPYALFTNWSEVDAANHLITARYGDIR